MKIRRFEHITTSNEFLILHFLSIVLVIICSFIFTGCDQVGESQAAETGGHERRHGCVQFKRTTHHSLLLLRL